jgi:hypothetical protein
MIRWLYILLRNGKTRVHADLGEQGRSERRYAARRAKFAVLLWFCFFSAFDSGRFRRSLAQAVHALGHLFQLNQLGFAAYSFRFRHDVSPWD